MNQVGHYNGKVMKSSYTVKSTIELAWLLFVVLALSACNLPSSSSLLPGDELPVEEIPPGVFAADNASRTWYVSTSGDDDNECSVVGLPCQTIEGVISKVNAEETRLLDSYPLIRDILHTIHVAAGTYLEPPLLFDKYIILEGAGRNSTTIDTNHPDNTVIEVMSPSVTINDITIKGGYVGISVINGSSDTDVTMLTLNQDTVEGNLLYGLWIHPEASASINGTKIVENGGTFTTDGLYTGFASGIHNEGHLEIFNSQISDNFYGGINTFLEQAFTEITDSTISGNAFEGAERSGGVGAAIGNRGTTVISGSAIHNNRLWGITNSGALQITNSTISSNLTGVSSSTFTFSGFVSSSLEFNYVTIAENEQSGLVIVDGSEASVTSSLIVNNGEEDCTFHFLDTSEVAFDFSGNINSDGTCTSAITVTPDDLFLAPLADNGGATLTHALLPGSPAIDYTSTSEFIVCIDVDQRGVLRPTGLSCDLGAYEVADVLLELEPPIDILPDTPIPPIFQAEPIIPIVNRDTLCWKGPGPAYDVVTSIQNGTEVELLGIGATENWLVINNPRYPGVDCWVDQDDLDLDPGLDLSSFNIFPIPLLPTATHTPSPVPLTPTATPIPVIVLPNAPSSLVANEQKCNSTDGYIVMLTWKDNANNEDGYRVFHNGNQIANLGPDATQYTTGDLGTGGTQSFYILAYNAAGTAQSNTAQEDGCIF